MARVFSDCPVLPWTRDDFDLSDHARGRALIERERPELIILSAALVDINAAEADPDYAFRVNAFAPRWMARCADSVGAAFVYLSTDYVFPGDGGAPYREWDEPRPLSVYGRSKLAGEYESLRQARRTFVVRTSWVFGGSGRTFVNAISSAASQGKDLSVVADEIGSPTFAPDLADGIRRLVAADVPGVYHLSNAGECSRFEFARAILDELSRTNIVHPTRTADGATEPNRARRPAHSTLANTAAAALGVTMRDWRHALHDHLCAPRS